MPASGTEDIRYDITPKDQTAWSSYWFIQHDGASAMFTIEFFRVRDTDDAHAILGRVEHDTTDLEGVKVRARSLFETLDMPQKPDALRVLDERGDEVFVWSPESYRT
jgi:hypothetical protein